MLVPRFLRTSRFVGLAPALATLALGGAALASVPWHLDRIDQRNLPLDGRFDPCASGAGVNIFIVSSGIEYTHPEFGDRAVPFWDFDPDGDGSDRVGHGTWLASLAGGSVSGVARSTTLRSVRAFDDCGRTTLEILGQALEAIAAEGPRPGVAVLPFAFEDVPELDAMAEELRNAGIMVVAAAGDEDRNACGLSPGRSASTVTVGASDLSDEHASWSAYGSCVDLYAPGEVITAAWPGNQTATFDSSSASAALAGGVGAVYQGLGQDAERKLKSCTSGGDHRILLLDCGCRWGPVREWPAALARDGGAVGTSTPLNWHRLVDEITPCSSDLDGDCMVGFGDLLAVLAGWGPCATAFDGLVGIGWEGELHRIDTTTGYGTPIGTTGFAACNSMATDSAGRVFVVSEDQTTGDDLLIQVDPDDASATVVAPLSGLGESGSVRGLAFDSNDELFAVVLDEGWMLARIHADGATEIVGTTGVPHIQGLAFDATDTLYFVDVGRQQLGTIDVATGRATFIGGDGLAPATQTLEFDVEGRLYAAHDDLVMVDPATGIATRIGPTGYDVRGLAAPMPAACPLDLDASGAVDFGDLLIVLSDWGPCD